MSENKSAGHMSVSTDVSTMPIAMGLLLIALAIGQLAGAIERHGKQQEKPAAVEVLK